MKKILLITFEYPTHTTAYCGGVGQIVKQCRDALLGMGYEVYVLISPGFLKKHPVKLLLPDGPLLRFSNFWAFQKKYDLGSFDYIIHHFVNWAKELRKLRRHKKARPKIIYHFHSILKRERDSGFRTLNNFLINQEKLIKIADKIICPSRYEYDNFIRYFPQFSDKITLIENTLESFLPQTTMIQNIRCQYGIKKTDIVSIYVGRLERIKGADIIIGAMTKILKKHKNLKIFVIGKILERSLYRDLLKAQKKFPHQIFYIKYLKKKILFQLYYLSHIYINTSRSESFSLATHESALCGTALLLNSLPIFDKFKDAALFFSPHEEGGNDFIRQYEYLTKNRRLRNRLSGKARKIVKDFLSNNRLKENFSSLFKNLER